MNLLLDTHAFLWFIGGNPSLSPTARQLIEEVSNQPFLSVASVWEMAIKVSLGKLTLNLPFENFILDGLQLSGISLLDITIPHTGQLLNLPFHHRDPFDRLLIAQAIVENIPLVSSDVLFDSYPVTRMW